MVSAVAAMYGVPGKDRPEKASRAVRNVPATIASDCSRNVDAELNAFFAGVPDGAAVNFPRGACYAQAGSILLKGRSDLLIDGHNSTFKSSAPNDDSKLVPNWWLLRSRGITLRNMTTIGNFTDRGEPNVNRGSVTSNAGLSIYGGEKITVSELTVKDVFGDGITFGNAAYFDPGTDEFPADVRISRIDVSNAARHCVSVSQGTDVWVTDGTLDRCFLDGIDAEKDLITDPLGDLHFLRLRVSNFFGVGIIVPIGGPVGSPVRGVEISDNEFTTVATASPCNQAIVVGGYENQYFDNVVIERNRIRSTWEGIKVFRALGGSVDGNRFTHPDGGGPRSGCGVNEVTLVDSSLGRSGMRP